MKNIVITALLVSNLFTALVLHGFTSGKLVYEQQDYLSAMNGDTQPVKLARR